MLAGLGERRLDDEVVHRHGPRERGARAVAAQLAGDSSSSANVLTKPHVSSGRGRLQRARDAAVAALDDLVHEAVEEDRVARLVDLLGGEEVLLLLARGGVDERRRGRRRPRPRRGRTSRSSTARRGARARRSRSCHWRAVLARSRSRSRASCRAPSARRGPRRRPVAAARHVTDATTRASSAWSAHGPSSPIAHALLRERVAIAQRDGVVLERLVVDVIAYGVPISSWRR